MSKGLRDDALGICWAALAPLPMPFLYFESRTSSVLQIIKQTSEFEWVLYAPMISTSQSRINSPDCLLTSDFELAAGPA
jgi:hypothetical protein